MKIHWLQHVEFEDLGQISGWIEKERHALSCTRMYTDDPLPQVADIDMLIIMGGPMGIYDEDEYPWLVREKKFIRQCVKDNKAILGICLGAQLLADALGGEVQPHRVKEIGWFAIHRCQDIDAKYHDILPESLSVLHWHGDTFTLPPGASHLYRSIACENQAFICQEKMVGIQFHLEIGESELRPLIENCRDELVNNRWIQTEEELHRGAENSDECNYVLHQLLDCMN